MNSRLFKVFIKSVFVVVAILLSMFFYLNSGKNDNVKTKHSLNQHNYNGFYNKKGARHKVDCTVDQKPRNTSDSVCSQEQRKAYLHSMCKLHGYPGGRDVKTKFYLDTVNKIAWHEVAKAGSTSIKTLLVRVASGNLTQVYFNVHSIQINALLNGIGIYTEYLTPALAKRRLIGYTKLLVVRNPMARLISAYSDKIVFYDKYVNNEYKEFKAYLEQINSPEATWPIPALDRFLEMLISKHIASTNIHWSSYFKSSNPCYIDYDYILKLETLADDLPFFIRNVYGSKYQMKNKNELKMNMRENIKSKQSSTDKFIEGYTKANGTLVEKVLKAFCFDAKFFGYGFSVKTNIAHCSIPGYQCC